MKKVIRTMIVFLVMVDAFAHHLRHHSSSGETSQKTDIKSLDKIPYSYKKLDKMMKKAILQIILGDLHPADMLLLKALNYTLEEVMAIREHELSRMKEEQEMEARAKKQQEQELLSAKYQVAAMQRRSSSPVRQSSSFEAYNRQAVYDYENAPDDEHQNFDRAMEPHVVFKIRYDDSEFNSASDEKSTSAASSFQVSSNDPATDTPPVVVIPAVDEQLNDLNDTNKRGNEYEGLEWLGDDVYRVVPEALIDYEDVLEQDRQSIDDTVNDTLEYQSDYGEAYAGNDTDDRNLTEYQKFAMAQRRDQGQKAIEDIKLRVLAMTGRFNLTSSHNQVQRERLTMFSPTCQIPRNTDAEAWSEPYLMNMHFQLNLTSGEHVLAAKLRLFKLPQDIVTPTGSSSSSSSSSSTTSTYEEDEEDEKKIRVSVYFYTKSLKKHRVKKRLMDSIVTPLTSQGSHLALDVRQALRFWRPNAQQQHSNSNHGLVVQVEDQDGRALKPSLYIQEPSCQANVNSSPDEKAYQYVPALFIRACTRYVRFVNGKPEVYVHCRPSQRH